MGSLIPVCYMSDEMSCSFKLKNSFASISRMTWWNIHCMLLIVLVRSIIIVLCTFSNSLPCSSRRSHCWTKTSNILLTLVILKGLYVLMSVILFWLFLSIVVKDHHPKPSRTCPDFVTLLFNTFVMIVTISPSSYLDFQRMFVSDVTNLFRYQNFLTPRWTVLLTWG